MLRCVNFLIPNKKENRKPYGLRLFTVSDMIRTRGLLIRSQTLYPAELHSHIHLAQELSYNMEKVLSSTFSKSFKKMAERGRLRQYYSSFEAERKDAAFFRELRTSL